MVTMDEMVQGVKDHALAHYDEGGWDVIVECYDDEQIADLLTQTDYETTARRTLTWGKARTVKGAIRKVERQVVGIYADYQADARNSAF